MCKTAFSELIRLYDDFDDQLRFYYEQHFSVESHYECALRDCQWPDCELEAADGICPKDIPIPQSHQKITRDHALNVAATSLCRELGIARLPADKKAQPGRNFRKLLVASGQLPLGSARREGFEQELKDDISLAVRNAIYELRDWIDQQKNELQHDLTRPHRLHVDDLDSFSLVKDVSSRAANGMLRNGVLDWPEDRIRTAFEEILDIPFTSRHSPAELNDLITANVILDGLRVPTAFMLKGPGVKVSTLEIKHCGSQGNQLLKLFDSPAEIFSIQFVGKISESVVRDAEQKAQNLRRLGKQASLLVIDGQDTARILIAYGKTG
ncbi:hypothetical protein FF011L_12110 [Roseimaritima multifibrata]|uniref:Uncharacterized protein n=1 Tax=Roseimaritima multifibrata TaxID=1930274 RepID=A0A517MC48_9BACT|nr:hypothetical protein [Roseimaritima multifibrata]QDS92468.1 hypothetical protein FF011L_12110 [Roseimaritima multifibrata]